MICILVIALAHALGKWLLQFRLNDLSCVRCQECMCWSGTSPGSRGSPWPTHCPPTQLWDAAIMLEQFPHRPTHTAQFPHRPTHCPPTHTAQFPHRPTHCPPTQLWDAAIMLIFLPIMLFRNAQNFARLCLRWTPIMLKLFHNFWYADGGLAFVSRSWYVSMCRAFSLSKNETISRWQVHVELHVPAYRSSGNFSL